MPFVKGQSGNPGGKRKEKPFRDALMLVLKEPEDEPIPDDQRNKLRAVAYQLYKKAAAGDVPAITQIRDTTDGKPAQAIVGDDDEAPIRTTTRIELVDLVSGSGSSTPEA